MKKKTKLNTAGILHMADMLVANIKQYDQEYFGQYNEACGTTCCLAGMAYASEIGTGKFNRLAKTYYHGHSKYVEKVANPSILSGLNLLGLPEVKEDAPFDESLKIPQIFDKPRWWPEDLRQDYNAATTQKQRVVVALRALSRLLPDGKIDEDPKAIHTEIPYLFLERTDDENAGFDIDGNCKIKTNG